MESEKIRIWAKNMMSGLGEYEQRESSGGTTAIVSLLGEIAAQLSDINSHLKTLAEVHVCINQPQS